MGVVISTFTLDFALFIHKKCSFVKKIAATLGNDAETNAASTCKCICTPTITLNKLQTFLGLSMIGNIWDNVSTQLNKIYNVGVAFLAIIRKCYIKYL